MVSVAALLVLLGGQAQDADAGPGIVRELCIDCHEGIAHPDA